MWCLGPIEWRFWANFPNLFVLCVKNILQWKVLKMAIQLLQEKKKMRVFLLVGLPFSCPLPSREHNNVAGPFLRNLDWTSLSPRSISPYHTHVPLPIFFQSPPNYPSVFIYRIPLMRMSWWGGYSPGWWVPLCYIPDHMGPATHSWCDFLRTCIKCQLVLGRRIPLRHYFLILA